MSLLFVNGGAQRVDLGSAASLDNIEAGTLMVWCRPTSSPPAANSRIYTKGGSQGPALLVTSTGNVQFTRGRATTACSAIAATANFTSWAAGQWLCMAATWDSAGAAGAQKLYIGDQNTALTEPSAYSTQTFGSGAVTDDSAQNGWIGNSAAAVGGFDGEIAILALWNVQISTTNMGIWKDQCTPIVGGNMKGQWFLGREGTGSQLDYSGNGNAGTVTSATVGTFLPKIYYQRRRVFR